ncbi:MAG: NifB/NifX family molybdenum-iron cluster-binding protein [Promethearchaeota archaeon]
MRVAIPSMDEKGLDSEVCEHFGHSEYYTIIEIEKKLPPSGTIKKNLYDDEECKINIIKNDELEGHLCDNPINLILDQKVEFLITSNIGPTPFARFQYKGIKIYTGAFGTVREALRDFLCGMLSEMSTASCGGSCGHHNHHH